MIRGAMNEGKSTPINVRIDGKDLRSAHEVAETIQAQGRRDQRRGRLPHHAAARLSRSTSSTSIGPRPPTWAWTRSDVMRNVVAAFNSSIQFNKQNFWIDPVSHNQYYVGVQYPEAGHPVDRDAAERPDHQPGAERADSAARTW